MPGLTASSGLLPGFHWGEFHGFRKDYGIDNAQLHRLRHNMVVKTLILDRLCSILNCRIEDIMEYVPDEDNE